MGGAQLRGRSAGPSRNHWRIVSTTPTWSAVEPGPPLRPKIRALAQRLREAGGNVSQAARRAGLDRRNFRDKMLAQGLSGNDSD